MIDYISSYGNLNDIRYELRRFYTTCNDPYFLSPDYCINSFEELHRQDEKSSLFFIIKKSSNKIVGYIPLYINGMGIMKFINDDDTDFLSEVGQFNYGDYKKIAAEILRRKEIKKVDLNNFPLHSSFLHYLKHFFGTGCHIYAFNNHSFITSNEKTSLLNHLSSSGRSELKRVRKKNVVFGFNVHQYPEPFPAQKLRDLRKKMMQNRSRDENFLPEKTLEFVECLYSHGELEIFSKSSNEQFVSASLVLKNTSRKRMIWMDLYDNLPYINLSAYIDYIYYMDEKKLHYLNFGRGSYDYKASNFQPEIESLYNLRFSKSQWNLYFSLFYPAKDFIKRIIKNRK